MHKWLVWCFTGSQTWGSVSYMRLCTDTSLFCEIVTQFNMIQKKNGALENWILVVLFLYAINLKKGGPVQLDCAFIYLNLILLMCCASSNAHFSEWRTTAENWNVPPEGSREVEGLGEGGASPFQGHHFFLQRKILSKLHCFNLRTRSANVAPHSNESLNHYFFFFFLFALNRSLKRWRRKTGTLIHTWHSSSSYKFSSETQWTCYQSAWRRCLMYDTKAL